MQDKQIVMTIGEELLQELVLEAAVTRRYLESVPFEKFEYRPTSKSEGLEAACHSRCGSYRLVHFSSSNKQAGLY